MEKAFLFRYLLPGGFARVVRTGGWASALQSLLIFALEIGVIALLFYILYRVVKAAVRNGIREFKEEEQQQYQNGNYRQG